MQIVKLLILLVLMQLLPSIYARAGGNDLLLAEVGSKNIDPSAYLVSEKLDGVRAIWDGKVLRFRSGNTVPAPTWFTDALPNSPLDGELWLARGQFEALSGDTLIHSAKSPEPKKPASRALMCAPFLMPQRGGAVNSCMESSPFLF